MVENNEKGCKSQALQISFNSKNGIHSITCFAESRFLSSEAAFLLPSELKYFTILDLKWIFNIIECMEITNAC
jgi:hypothetical protein